MNTASKLMIAAAVVGGIAIMDVPQTIGLKTLFVSLLPMEGATKADMIQSLCMKALPKPIGAHGTCYSAHAHKDWKAARSERNIERGRAERGRRDEESLCRLAKNTLDKPIDARSVEGVIDNGEKATIRLESGSFLYVDRGDKTVTINRNGGFTTIVCDKW